MYRQPGSSDIEWRQYMGYRRMSLNASLWVPGNAFMLSDLKAVAMPYQYECTRILLPLPYIHIISAGQLAGRLCTKK